jgi:hypothetical protein
MSKQDEILGNGVRYAGARPLKVHVDGSGDWWLCDKRVVPGADFANAIS